MGSGSGDALQVNTYLHRKKRVAMRFGQGNKGGRMEDTMTFQIVPLNRDITNGLTELTDEELAARNIVRMTANVSPGFPCRVSLEDARIGEVVYLMNFKHLPEATPYQAAHAIFVRQDAEEASPAPGEVPDALKLRVLSLRGFGADHMLRAAELAQGDAVAGTLDTLFADPGITYVHLHNAKPGCYAARAVRAG